MLCVIFLLIAIIQCGVTEVHNTGAEEFNVQTVSLDAIKAGADTRIIGGTPADIKDFPFIVQVIVNRRVVCGGSILNKRHILSAAHCFVDQQTGVVNNPSFYTIRVGSSYSNRGGTVHAVSTIVVHHGYSTLNQDNDVAVLVLSSDVRLSTSVEKAFIPKQGQTLVDNSAVIALGWGLTDPQGTAGSEVLQQVSVRTVSRSVCRQRYEALGAANNNPYITITQNMLCAGLLDVGGADACSGDSGGPLVYSNVVVGITSWGASCAVPAYPGVYTKVSSFTTWIENTVNQYSGAASTQAGIIAVLLPIIFVIISV